MQGRYVDERYPTETAVAALMRADAFIARELSSEVHKLILACLTDDRFKGAFASEFAELYEDLADQYANGVGTSDGTIFGFSVQLFTTPSLVRRLMEVPEPHQKMLVEKLLDALDRTLDCASDCSRAGMDKKVTLPGVCAACDGGNDGEPCAECAALREQLVRVGSLARRRPQRARAGRRGAAEVLTAAGASWDCLLYTSPSPRD